MKKSETVKVWVPVPADLREDIALLATAEGRTMQEQARHMLRQYLEAEEPRLKVLRSRRNISTGV